jgi:hypothetical protein
MRSDVYREVTVEGELWTPLVHLDVPQYPDFRAFASVKQDGDAWEMSDELKVTKEDNGDHYVTVPRLGVGEKIVFYIAPSRD